MPDSAINVNRDSANAGANRNAENNRNAGNNRNNDNEIVSLDFCMERYMNGLNTANGTAIRIGMPKNE
ncbi:MAG TPA: hypothetical protein VG537_05245, partial [Candidatus Kapabacteria bacterium]|nr:hypothetical protein [Candidatus Kapabacteria bacterium]